MQRKALNTIFDRLDWPLRWFLQKLINLLGLEQHGALEAMRCKARIDTWYRYSLVRRHLESAHTGQKIRLLDVGGGAAEILDMVDASRYEIFTLDLNLSALKKAPSQARLICADALHMPFPDKTFDVLLSVDALEHIPNHAMRATCLEEMQRVTKNRMILHFPAVSKDGSYRGLEYDQLFNAAHQKYFGTSEPNTNEHLLNGLPEVDLVQQKLPDACIQGTSNCSLWYRYMLLQRVPFLRLFLVFWFQIWHFHQYNRPPYHGCLVVLDCAG
ncbi:MAG: class I SAM-dependent methyltransferase [bacterium]|nr:class I SAM-dependent methyltransferase [bacterium]